MHSSYTTVLGTGWALPGCAEGLSQARPQSAFPCNCTRKAGAPEEGCWALGFSHGGSLAVPGDLTVCWRWGDIAAHCGIPPVRGREHRLHLSM